MAWIFSALLFLTGFSQLCHAEKLAARGTGQVVKYAAPTPVDNRYASIGPRTRRDELIFNVDAGNDSVQQDMESQATGSSYAVEIVHPEDTSVPSLAADLNNNLMSNELMRQLEESYRQQLRDYNSSYGYYLNRRDTRASRPYGLTSEQDADMRHKMAKQSSKYMLLKGLPNFLKSRPATHDVGQAYDDALEVANRATSVEMKSESGWKYNTGLNPFEFKLFAKATNDLWHLEFSNKLVKKTKPFSHENIVGFLVGRNFGAYRFDTKYDLWARYQEVCMSHDF